MKNELMYFDITPKILPCGKEQQIKIYARSAHASFGDQKEWYVSVVPMNTRNSDMLLHYPAFIVKSCKGVLSFPYTFPTEQEYEIHIRKEDPRLEDWHFGLPPKIRLHVYAIEEDLAGLQPLCGNMHMHSFRSDGVEGPAFIAGMYRKAGYDFIAITDHYRYDPSLEAIDAYRDAPIDLKLFPGEEVHAPDNLMHIVNFGGSFSVNRTYEEDEAKYRAEVAELQKTVPPEIGYSFEVASCLWVFRQIRKGGGLSILCHPNWSFEGAYNMPDRVLDYFLDHHDYDFLELINGSDTPHENMLQVNAWYACKDRPLVVGVDDSHGTVNGAWFNIGKTYLLARSDSKEDIFAALKQGLCCAVEQYHGEYARLYGDKRLVRYFDFLNREYFPLHDEMCVEEGRMMLAYINQESHAVERLQMYRGQTKELYERLSAAR